MRKKLNPTIQTDYLNRVYEVKLFVKVVDRAVKTLTAFRKKNHFDAIAFTGTSGAALAYPLSIKMKVPLICVRKSVKDNHYGSKLEGCINARTYIIVDDFICSGSTMRKIEKAVKKGIWYRENTEPKLVGVYLYAQKSYGGGKYKDVPLLGSGA
jgi:orotate phosphoribosyltransferase-like protein